MKDENKKANRNKFKIYAAACLAAVLTVALLVGVMMRQADIADDNLLSVDGISQNASINDSGDNLIVEYSGDGTSVLSVKVKKADPKQEQIQLYASEWNDYSDFDIASGCDLVAKCKIIDVEEICMEVTELHGAVPVKQKGYGSILTLELEDVYSGNALKGQTVKAYTNASSIVQHEDAINGMTVGNEYCFFMYDSKDCTSSWGYDSICEYMILFPHTSEYYVKPGARLSGKMTEILLNNLADKNEAEYVFENAEVESVLTRFFKK